MFTKPMIRILAAIMTVFLIPGIGLQLVRGNAQAGLQTQPDQAVANQSRAGTIPYLGTLKDASGQPVPDGDYDFTFSLYAAETGEVLLWIEMQTGVPVRNGTFQAQLGSVQALPPAALDRNNRWLEVAVRRSGEGDFTTLIPRQRLTSTAPNSPSAASPCPHNHFGEQWLGSGIDGLMVSTTGYVGLQGWSTSYIGVVGISTPYSFVWPQGRSYGVLGYSYTDHGVYGRTAADWSYHSGVYGEASQSNANGVTGENTGGGVGVYGKTNGGHAGYFAGEVDVFGPFYASGTKSAVVLTQDYGWRNLYTVESTGVWFEDFGSAQLVDGQAVVTFDPIFVQTVNLTVTYHVYLTPLGDCPLFVAEKTPTSFTIQAMGGQTCAIAFDYRLVARRLGYEEVRVDQAPSPYEEGNLSPKE